jgi:hypothetical protein
MQPHLSSQRRSAYGHVVVTFVDRELRRRTLAVPFDRSAADDVRELVEHVCDHVPLRPAQLYDNGG